jgi:hypothetical protein
VLIQTLKNWPVVKNIPGGQKHCRWSKTLQVVKKYTIKPTLTELLTKGKIYVCLRGEHFRPVKNIAGLKMFWAHIHKNLEEEKVILLGRSKI